MTQTLVPQVLSIHLLSENYRDVWINFQARVMKMTLKFGKWILQKLLLIASGQMVKGHNGFHGFWQVLQR